MNIDPSERKLILQRQKHAARQRRYRSRLSEVQKAKVREYDRKRHLAHREQILERKRKYSREHRKEITAHVREWRRKHPGVHAARLRAQRHVPLKTTCEICGTNENLERHHPDYSKPLEVLTLCRTCHKRLPGG